MVLMLGIFAGGALQRNHWRGAGIFAALAASCWQPGVCVALACGAVATFEARARRHGYALSSWRNPLVRYATGLAIGVLPAVLYLAYTNTWLDFWTRSVVLPAQLRLPEAGTDPLGKD